MAAPVLQTTAFSGKKSGKIQKTNKQKSIRNVLLNTYQHEWPDIPGKQQYRIKQKLKEVLSQSELAARKKACEDNDGEAEDRSRSMKLIKAQIKIGINVATRSLEKDELTLVLVDRSASPSELTNHLLPLASVRNCSILRLYSLSQDIGPLLGVSSLLVLGFKKNVKGTPVFENVVNYIKAQCGKPDIPWSDTPTLDSRGEGAAEENNTGEVPLNKEGENREETYELIKKKLKEIFYEYDLPGEKKKSLKDPKARKDLVKRAKPIRNRLKIGIKPVMRSLGQGELGLVLVDGSARPAKAKELEELLATQSTCRRMTIPNLSAEVSPLLLLPNLLALGFTRNDGAIQDMDALVNFIKERCEAQEPVMHPQKPKARAKNKIGKKGKCQQPTTKEQPKVDSKRQPHTNKKLPKMDKLPPIDFSSIYILKSESKLINGKVDTEGFGTSEFIAFGDHSSDENEGQSSTSKRKKKSSQKVTAGSKRQHDFPYKSATIGKMQGNEDRSNSKKKRVE